MKTTNRVLVHMCLLAMTGCGKDSSTPLMPADTGQTGISVLAFGDDLTAGVGAMEPYPQRLQKRFELPRTIPVSVRNEGRVGERAASAVGRLAEVLRATRSDFVLLLTGTQDVIAADSPSQGSVEAAADAVQAMVRSIRRERGIVLVGTLPALGSDLEQPGDARANRKLLVDAFNARVRQLAVEPHVYVVDVARTFGEESGLTRADGGFPTQSGYDRIADAFAGVLQELITVARGGGGCADRTPPPRFEPVVGGEMCR